MTCFSRVVKHLQLCSDVSRFAFPRLRVDFLHLFSATSATKMVRTTTYVATTQYYALSRVIRGYFLFLNSHLLTCPFSILTVLTEGLERCVGPLPLIFPRQSPPPDATWAFCLINNLSVMYRAATFIWLSARWVWRWPHPLLLPLLFPPFFNPPPAVEQRRSGPSQEGACEIARSL